MEFYENKQEPEKAVLIAVDTGEYDCEVSLDELEELAKTAGAEVIGEITQKREALDSATYIGKGKLEELSEFCEMNQPDLIIVDGELSPSQQRNIENFFQCSFCSVLVKWFIFCFIVANIIIFVHIIMSFVINNCTKIITISGFPVLEFFNPRIKSIFNNIATPKTFITDNENNVSIFFKFIIIKMLIKSIRSAINTFAANIDIFQIVIIQ